MSSLDKVKIDLESMSDDDVIDWAIPRIEQEDWTGCLDGLTEYEKDFIRGVRFQLMFGNGGLQYFFEGDKYGRGTAESLHRLGLQDLAKHLDRVFEYAPAPPGCRFSIDLERMIETHDPLFFELDEAIWNRFEAITPALASFVRQHPDAFAHLLNRQPYDPLKQLNN